MVRPSSHAGLGVNGGHRNLAIPNPQEDLDYVAHGPVDRPRLLASVMVRAADRHILGAAVGDEAHLGQGLEVDSPSFLGFVRLRGGLAGLLEDLCLVVPSLGPWNRHGVRAQVPLGGELEVLRREGGARLRVAVPSSVVPDGRDARLRPRPDRRDLAVTYISRPGRIDFLQLVSVPLEAELLVAMDANPHRRLEGAYLLAPGGQHLHGLPRGPRAADVVPVPVRRQLRGQAKDVLVQGGLPSDYLLPRLQLPLQGEVVDRAAREPLRPAVYDPVVPRRSHARAQDDGVLTRKLTGRENLEVLVLVHEELELFHTRLSQWHCEDVAAKLLHVRHLLGSGPAIEGAYDVQLVLVRGRSPTM
mmetsp:Transcript_89369/g.278033  ORF Transcript_89369/g.278033 Transcript_89369/m.278033 type:complete len:359 (-) Transcript_89369:839-1915(-)